MFRVVGALVLLLAACSLADDANMCGGSAFGWPEPTKCCEWDGTAFRDYESGVHPNGTVYDFEEKKCDAACGVIVSVHNCCGGAEYSDAAQFCCSGVLGTWDHEAPCPDYDPGDACEIAPKDTSQCCGKHGEAPDVRPCGAGTACEYCEVECVCV